MASSRIFDSDERVQTRTSDSSFVGAYYLQTPGPGSVLPYSDDIFTRMTHWSGGYCHAATSLGKNAGHIDIESDLRGQTRTYTKRDYGNKYTDHAVVSVPMPYVPTAPSYTDDSRTTHPAWAYRAIENPRYEFPLVNPQYLAGIPVMHQDLQTRILEKDYYVPNSTGYARKC